MFIYTFFLLKMLLSLFVSTDEMQHIMIHLGNVRDFLISSGNFVFLQNSMAQKNRHPTDLVFGGVDLCSIFGF